MKSRNWIKFQLVGISDRFKKKVKKLFLTFFLKTGLSVKKVRMRSSVFLVGKAGI
jgi:hypothetical protein